MFKRYFGRKYETLGELIFGYLLIFLTMPIFLPYWLAKKSFIKINKAHGFSNYESDPDKNGVVFIMNAGSVILFLFTFIFSCVPKELGGISILWSLIPVSISMFLVP